MVAGRIGGASVNTYVQIWWATPGHTWCYSVCYVPKGSFALNLDVVTM